MKTYSFQFWAKYRGYQEVTIVPPFVPEELKRAGFWQEEFAREVAERAINQAIRQYEARFTFSAYDQARMVCTGMTDGFEVLNANGTRGPLTPELRKTLKL